MTYVQNVDGTITAIQDEQTETVMLIDRSGTIAAGNTAQQLAPANPTRRGYRVMNVSAGDLWVNDKGVPAIIGEPSFKIAANVLFESPVNGVSGASLSIIGATTGQAFEASEF